MKWGWMCLVVLAGCSSTSTNTTVAEPKPSDKIPERTKTATTPAPTAPPVSQTAKSTDNANRIHQLKDLKVVPIKVNGHPIQAWLMDTESKRAEGMMFLVDKDVKENEGMLFVFKDLQKNDGEHGFWMANCPLGLDIIYVNPDKQVLNVGDGKPFNRDSVAPAGDYLWVVELKRGTASKLGIRPGSKVEIPSGTKAQE